jgi:hypothetical protein
VRSKSPITAKSHPRCRFRFRLVTITQIVSGRKRSDVSSCPDSNARCEEGLIHDINRYAENQLFLVKFLQRFTNIVNAVPDNSQLSVVTCQKWVLLYSFRFLYCQEIPKHHLVRRPPRITHCYHSNCQLIEVRERSANSPKHQ